MDNFRRKINQSIKDKEVKEGGKNKSVTPIESTKQNGRTRCNSTSDHNKYKVNKFSR